MKLFEMLPVELPLWLLCILALYKARIWYEYDLPINHPEIFFLTLYLLENLNALFGSFPNMLSFWDYGAITWHSSLGWGSMDLISLCVSHLFPSFYYILYIYVFASQCASRGRVA